jgi:uncharacterized protein YecE (DUF72 family)
LAETGKILIGPAGWSYKDWEGVVYPPQLKKSQHPAEYLAQFFDLIEINTSFYGHIKPETAKLWTRKAAAVNSGFTFTAKAHKCFTHSPLAVIEGTSAATIRSSPEDEKLAIAGYEAMAAQGHLGALLLQFPISFKNTDENRAYLESLLEKLKAFPLVVEVRHASWNAESTLAYFAGKGVAFCNIDQPLLGRAIGPTQHVTSSIGYARLHGRNYDQWFNSDSRNDRYNYLYTEKQLAGWKTKIETIAEKAKTTFVVANNHFQGKAVVNALQLKHMITGERVRAPEILIERYRELEQIAEPVRGAVVPDAVPLRGKRAQRG